MSKSEKFITRVLLFVVVLLNVSNPSFSQTTVKALPGFPGELPFKLETGYVEVGEKEDVALFYYFVESERNPTSDPLLIWISGGPGCSTLRSFFYQTGPLRMEYPDTSKEIPDLHLNPYTWTKLANILYLDAPRAGFSYSKSPETYKNSDTLTAKYTYQFLCKWLEKHPKFISNTLYISGNSYSGITIPLIVQEIYNGNEAGNEPRINIAGYILGNPLTDRNVDFNSQIPYAHQMALLSHDLYESTKANCNGEYVNVHASNTLCQRDLQKVEEENTYLYNDVWANNLSVQKALNIRQGTVEEWINNNSDHYVIGKNDTVYYSYDVSSTVDIHRSFTKKSCRALINSGDHDMVFSHLGTRLWIGDLHLNVDSTWAPWFVNQQVAGYTESFSQDNFTLTFATVKGAGHGPVEYKPEECLAMFSRWLDHNHL